MLELGRSYTEGFFHRRVAENAETSQRRKPLRNLCVLCDSAVNLAQIVEHYFFTATRDLN